MAKKKTGVQEWAGTSINIQRGCENDCRYCWARHDAVNRYHRCRAEHWPLPCIDNKKVDAPHKKKYDGVVMFPTTHDITQANITQYCCVLHKLLDAGNDVLIVTKPHWDCITIICEGFAKRFKKQIVFRFTIGSTSNECLEFWEQGAANFTERIACLQYAFEAGFQTSVSCEPYLDPFPFYVYEACKGFLTDSFWIGKLRNWDSRVVLDGATPDQVGKYVETLRKCQSDEYVKVLYKMLDGKPYIMWKESIRKVVSDV